MDFVMNLIDVVEMTAQEKENPLTDLWMAYNLSDIPIAIYDDDEVRYIGHPSPPQERPRNLMAATSVDINGTETATIPMWICTDAVTALPIIYHEGFHVYQYHHFKPILPDMFTAMAYYPELDLEYRVLCRLESQVLHSDAPTADKLTRLARLTALRRERLTHHESLLTYERFLERSEGTAKYVEQKARLERFGVTPEIPESSHGWSRFYEVGAAVCWLFDEVLPDWKTRIESGESTGDILLEWDDPETDLTLLDEKFIRQEETAALTALQHSIDEDLAQFNAPDTTQIYYTGSGGQGPIYRAFNPSTLVSLGDGRILHRQSFQLLLPERGKVSIKEIPVIDDIANGVLIFNAPDIALQDEHLTLNTERVQIDLKGVRQESDHVYRI